MRLLACIACLACLAASAQGGHDPAALLAAQREAMKALAFMDGLWRGPAWSLDHTGKRHEITQTERIGPFLDGAVKVVEGRGYHADGRTGFNAFGIISYDPGRKAYAMRSYAMGRATDVAFVPRPDGFQWEVPAGPRATIRYTATFRDGSFHEYGEHLMEGREPLRVLEMTLRRIGPTDWPAEGAVPPK